jgi:hypothetical protein
MMWHSSDRGRWTPMLLAAAFAALPTTGCEMVRNARTGGGGASAGAGAPSVEECATANENAQALRRSSKLRKAKEQLLVCVAQSCPGPVREDCVDRLGEVEKATPTVLFAVKDAGGVDLSAVKVQADDVLLTDHLDGSAIAVDPGKHHFTFTMPGGGAVQRDLVIHEGEKARHESIAFGAPLPGHDPTATGAAAVETTPTISDEDKAGARMLGSEGIKLAASGDCANAVDRLTRAEALVHAPTTAVPLAQCEIKLGKLVAGTEILNRVGHESLPPTAPKAWIDASQKAAGLLAAAAPRIAKLRVHVDAGAGAPSGLQVTVDGEPLASALLDNDRPTDPGSHHVAAHAPGFATAEVDVALTDGQSQAVTLSLEPAPPSPGAGPPGPPAAATPAPAPPGDATTGAPSRVPAYALLGVGAVGIVVGSVTGIVAIGAKSSLNSVCAQKVCPTSSQGDIDTLRNNAVISTVGWSIGIVGAAVGVYLFASTHAPESQKAASVRVSPWIGLGSAGIGGDFR